MDNQTEVSPEQEAIRRQMEETRTSLQEKLETLENQVKETVEEATEAVNETVQTVKEVVQGTVETVKESVETVKGSVENTVETVKQTFDLRRQVCEHPWPMFLGAAAVGFVGGKLLDRFLQEAAPESLSGNGHQGNGYAASYIGKAEDALWTKSQDLLSEVKLLPAGQDPKTYYTNAYLPPASEMRACK